MSDPTAAKDPLFAQILRRHTNRNAYDPARPVPAAALTAMTEAVQPHPLHFGFVAGDDGAAVGRHRAIASEA